MQTATWCLLLDDMCHISFVFFERQCTKHTRLGNTTIAVDSVWRQQHVVREALTHVLLVCCCCCCACVCFPSHYCDCLLSGCLLTLTVVCCLCAYSTGCVMLGGKSMTRHVTLVHHDRMAGHAGRVDDLVCAIHDRSIHGVHWGCIFTRQCCVCSFGARACIQTVH
jgi:hypothetical protein